MSSADSAERPFIRRLLASLTPSFLSGGRGVDPLPLTAQYASLKRNNTRLPPRSFCGQELGSGFCRWCWLRISKVAVRAQAAPSDVFAGAGLMRYRDGSPCAWLAGAGCGQEALVPRHLDLLPQGCLSVLTTWWPASPTVDDPRGSCNVFKTRTQKSYTIGSATPSWFTGRPCAEFGTTQA